MAACETDPGALDTALSGPESASCCPVLTAAVVVVQGHIALQGQLHIFTTVESVGLHDLRYAAIEPWVQWDGLAASRSRGIFYHHKFLQLSRLSTCQYAARQRPRAMRSCVTAMD